VRSVVSKEAFFTGGPAPSLHRSVSPTWVNGLQHVEGSARNRRVSDRAAELAIADLITSGDPKHELAGPIRLPIATAHQVIAPRSTAAIMSSRRSAPGRIAWRERLLCSGCGDRQVDMVVTGTERRRPTSLPYAKYI
jgi:hypothetical protein